MKNYEFRLTNGARVYGFCSWVDHANELVYVLGPNQVGQMGKDGTPLRFQDLAGVKRETTRPGIFDSDDQLQAWRRWSRDNRSRG